MASLMLLEADLARLFHTAAHGHVRCILQLDFEEENKVFEKVEMLKEKKLWVAAREKAKVEQPPQRGLA